MEPPLKWGTKVYINGPGHMTKMAAMPIYCIGKTLIIFFSRTGNPIILKFDTLHLGLEIYKVYINGDPGMTLTYLTGRSNLAASAFEWGENVTK